jgi:mxaJ protein
MFSLSRSVWLGLCLSLAVVAQVSPCRAEEKDLRVCADPNNLPFSNIKEQGFENRIAEIVAADLHAHLSYVWQRMGRGFVREFLNKGRCDLLIGIPTDFKPVLTTAPYYRSTYVFVVRRDAAYKPVSLEDPALRKVKIGVQALDEEYTPPAEALMQRGMRDSLVTYHTVGEDAEAIVRAVLDKQVALAVVWGPLAGYWAHQNVASLECTPVQPESEPPGLPFTFEISIGVRRGNTALRDAVQQTLTRRNGEIRNILANFGVPLLENFRAQTQLGAS